MKKNTNKPADNANKPTKSIVVGSGVPWMHKGLNQRLIAKIRPVSEDNLKVARANRPTTPLREYCYYVRYLKMVSLQLRPSIQLRLKHRTQKGGCLPTMGMLQSGELPASMYSYFNLDAETADDSVLRALSVTLPTSWRG